MSSSSTIKSGEVEERGSELRVEFTTGRPSLARHALFIQPGLVAQERSGAVSLGAVLTELRSVETDASGQSSVPGLYAAGDAGTPAAVGRSGGRERSLASAYAMNSEPMMEDTAP